MTQTVGNITLGTGRLYFDDVEVGYLKGDVEFVYNRERLDFKPSGATTPVAQFIITETCELRASIAEFKARNLRMAMGVTAAISSFTGVSGSSGDNADGPSYNPASFSAIEAEEYDMVKFGGEEVVDFTNTIAVRFEHEIRGQTSAAQQKIVVILYAAVCLGDLSLAFHEEDFVLTDIVFTGTCVVARPAGDQIGMIIRQQT